MSILYHMHHILEVQVIPTLHKLPVVQETSFRRKPPAGPGIMLSHKPLEDRGYAFLRRYKRHSDQDSSFHQGSFESLGKILQTILDLRPARLCQVLDPYKDHSRHLLRHWDRLCKAGWG